MDLTKRCINYARECGADLIGIASVNSYKEDSLSENHPQFYLKNAKTVIVVGLKLVDALWDNLRGKKDVHGLNLHSYLLYYNYNLLDYIAIQTARFLEEEGYDAYPIQARTETYRDGILSGYFDFKNAAVAAGLGSIGKNTLLITPEYGQRVRLVAIITDAPLINNKPNSDLPGSECVDCTLCIDACPVSALSFDEDAKRPIIDKIKCQYQLTLCQCAYCQGICKYGHQSAEKRRKRKAQG